MLGLMSAIAERQEEAKAEFLEEMATISTEFRAGYIQNTIMNNRAGKVFALPSFDAIRGVYAAKWVLRAVFDMEPAQTMDILIRATVSHRDKLAKDEQENYRLLREAVNIVGMEMAAPSEFDPMVIETMKAILTLQDPLTVPEEVEAIAYALASNILPNMLAEKIFLTATLRYTFEPLRAGEIANEFYNALMNMPNIEGKLHDIAPLIAYQAVWFCINEGMIHIDY